MLWVTLWMLGRLQGISLCEHQTWLMVTSTLPSPARFGATDGMLLATLLKSEMTDVLLSLIASATVSNSAMENLFLQKS